MKKILILITSLTMFSCSNDDSGSETESSVFTDALPLHTGNYWTYDVEGTTTTRDSLYISGDTLIESISYKKFKNRDNISTGFYPTSLNNNGVRKSGGKLLMSGEFSLGQGFTLPVGLDLTLRDFIIFNENASNGTVLNEKAGTFQQDFNGIPLNVVYSLKSIAGNDLPNYTSPNNDVYTNVKSTKIVLNLKVTTTQTVAGIPFTVTVLAPQDVVVSTQYLSKNIGVVHTNTITSYNIDTQIASNLGIPASNTETQNEFLDTFNID